MDSKTFNVGKIVLKYEPEHAGQPPVEGFNGIVLEFTETANGLSFRRRREGKHVTYTLAELNAAPPRAMDWPAIESVCKQVLKRLNDQGFVGVQVGPDSDDISAELDPKTGRVTPSKDLRAADNTDLHIVIHTASVTGIRTVAVDGDGNNAASISRSSLNIAAGIRCNRATVGAGVAGQTSPLLRQDALDDYVLRLNRFPGRHVDAAIAAGEDPEHPAMCPVIIWSRRRPYQLRLAEISNTGTKENRRMAVKPSARPRTSC